MLSVGEAAETPADGLKPEWFTRDDYASRPQISPDGTHLAWVRGNEVVILDLADETEKTMSGGVINLEGVDWINNDYLAVYVKSKEQEQNTYVRVMDYSPMVVTRDAKYVRPLLARGGDKIEAADLMPIIRFVDGPEPYVITFGGKTTYLTEVRTGKWKVGPVLLDGSLHFFDSKGRERMSADAPDGKVSYGAESMIFRYRAEPGGKVQTLKLPKQDKVYYVNCDYSEFENALYWSEFDYSKGVGSIYKYDFASSQKTLFRTVANKDLDIVFDRLGRVIGITTVTDRVHTEWIDPYRLKITAGVQKAFPQATVTVVDVSQDEKDVVLMVSAPDAPDSYYYYDAEAKDLSQVEVNYPELEGQPLAEMSYVTYKARDGLDIPAYVTRRKDTPANAPLIVLPHGGPAARDVYGFGYEAQYLASRGYVVLQPQYRGSAGFGDAFQRAGNKNLDKMTTDLEDGVRYLKAQGMIDSAKVCVVGWSWGGYLAQASLAFMPDTYACGVSGAGISDLAQQLEAANDFWWGGYGIEYWREVIGQPLMDAKTIHATSPINHVEAIKAPLLLIHGEADPIISYRQSERMRDAMTKAGKAVTYLPVKFMPHSPRNAEQRLMILKAMDAFIASAFSGKPAATAN
ncbi:MULTISPECIES: S9 family peptidase [Asticcacaulis]|uniref:alpha/beta hydrolase family protein n=1 Tax=Asticcacaulis TaxID=76890 RepID=UPI001AE837A6|nr:MULTISPECIES: alpha/beta fold hydrolase [Asticcacaulis]MBP2158983.1 dienelactone hydrolase [Asticcacaulis solisilvae]MDR6800028.1 dienelactone hydrolase [Asticcacaulis sp. BE141]